MKLPKITAIDDTGVLRDAMMTINMYLRARQLARGLDADALFPEREDPDAARHLHAERRAERHPRRTARPRAMAAEPGWATSTCRKLDVEYHAPIHGDYVTNKQFLDSLIFMTQFVPGTKSTN